MQFVLLPQDFTACSRISTSDSVALWFLQFFNDGQKKSKQGVTA